MWRHSCAQALLHSCYQSVTLFSTEYRRAELIEWEGAVVRVLPLERIIRSKEAADRDKDRAVLPLLRDIAASRKKLRIRR